MINMVIADDECVILSGLQKLINWETYGIHIAGCYEDGRSALKGILESKAQIALLDINMPKMSGVDILKEVNKLGIPTKIIFISGFQEFEYAKAAIEFGAKGYILKPVIRQELLDIVQKCVEELYQEDKEVIKPNQEIENTQLETLIDMEDTSYTPALLYIASENANRMEKKLIQFSVQSCLEEKLKLDNRGIIFSKNGDLVFVFKGMDRAEIEMYFGSLFEEVVEKTKYQIGILVGETVKSMGEIPAMYRKCCESKGYFFFFTQWSCPILFLQSIQAKYKKTPEELEKGRKKMMELLIKQDEQAWERQFIWYRNYIASLSAGNREDAGFYFCIGIRAMQQKMQEMGLSIELDTKELLEKGRDVENYGQMAEAYGTYYRHCYQLISKEAEKSENKPLYEAKKYIEEHFRESLSLDVLADQIHMNAYYFSSYFKKNTGMNFKEYLNEIRLEHAVALMISTDKTVSEVAMEVGFCDMRAFTKAFHKKYEDTPGNYKKRIIKG